MTGFPSSTSCPSPGPMFAHFDHTQDRGTIPQTVNAPASYPALKHSLIQDGLWESGTQDSWRLSCRPFVLSPDQAKLFEALGRHLLIFYQALNKLYLDSVKGREPRWVHQYLDLGKPPELLDFARMNRFKDHIPGVIRPDLILTESGIALTELDSVPGGMGLTGSLSRLYAKEGYDIWPASDGLVKSLARMVKSVLQGQPPSMAIVVSDEAESYRSEMQWMAEQLCGEGVEAFCVHPKDIRFTEEGLLVRGDQGEVPISLIYRFYELFDLKNIPKAELLWYSAKKGKVLMTPPYKPWMEEKLALALFHHPLLEAYWERTLTPAVQECLRTIIPKTWILDPRPLPPSAVLPGLFHNNRAVSDWTWLETASQKERQYVVKVSGFSEQAWGSRGVSIGHDMSQTLWQETVSRALKAFETSPSILQVFHKGQVVMVEYYDQATGAVQRMEGRVRLSPYYCVAARQAELAGVLATICPKDKKIIHGMRDAVMVPCAVA
ncbi:MAG: hypothetical protein AB7P17_10415 [Nitrospirales bacterium]|nr:hypothetical protein [Nitrospirales bacterium]